MEFDVSFSKDMFRQREEETVPVLSREDVHTAKESYLKRGGTLINLIESFTEMAALHLSEITNPAETLVVCGPGYNGAEGFSLARLLKKYDYPVTIALDTSYDQGLTPEYMAERNTWHGKIFDYNDVNYGDFDLVIDCLYGSDLFQTLRGKDLKVIEWINISQAHVVSLDCPSGLDVNSGQLLGASIRADITITCFGYRAGFERNEGLKVTGGVVIKVPAYP